MNDPIALRVAARFARLLKAEQEAAHPHDEAFEFLKKSKLHEMMLGMAAEAKKDGQQFGMRDAKEAMEHWFAGGREVKTPKQVAARRYLMTDKGKSVLTGITKGVADALKKSGGQVGYRDIGHAIISFLTN